MTDIPPGHPCEFMGASAGLASRNYTFVCYKGGTYREWTFAARNKDDANIQMKTAYGDPFDSGYDLGKSPGTQNPDGEGGTSGTSTGCVPHDTLILLHDGQDAPISELKVGDKVKACKFGESEVIIRTIEGITVSEETELIEIFFNNNTSATTSMSQSIMTPYGPVKAAYIYNQASVLSLDEKQRELTISSIIRTQVLRNSDETQVYSLNLGGDFLFFAGEGRRGMACHKSSADGKIIKL